MVNIDSTTRAALESAAFTVTFSRSNGVRQGACPFMNSHRNGECSRCVEMHAHDAELARVASLGWKVAA